MVTRSQFLGGGVLALLATQFSTSQAVEGSPSSTGDYGSTERAPHSAPLSSRLIIATEHGISSDGSVPINQKVNSIVHELAGLGGGTIIFPPGLYAVDPSGIEMRNQVTIMGLGEATQFVPVGNWTELGGVFRIGSPHGTNTEPVYRTGLYDFSIKAGKDPNKHAELKANVVGVYYNTYNGERPSDPDAAHRISGLTLWDLDMGIVLKGRDDQGMTVERIRGRRFLRSGIVVGEDGAPGAADNQFSLIDISSTNHKLENFAAIEVYTSNTSWSQVKTWYSKCGAPLIDDVYNGAGFYIKGTRNTFSQCDAQDNGGHGFVIKFGNNSFTNCVADSNGWEENLLGTARSNQAHGFHISMHAQGTQLLGCMAFNRTSQKNGQNIGFWVHEKNTQVILSGNAFNNSKKNSSAHGLTMERHLLIDGKGK